MVKTKNYQNGKIYQVVDIAHQKSYIGSTIDTLASRFKGHRTHYKQFLNGKTSKYTSVFDMFDEFGIENCKILLIEEYPCNNLMELHQKEGEHIKQQDCINKRIAGRTAKERYDENPNIAKERSKQYYKEHLTEIQEYRNNNSEHLKEIKRKNYHENKAYYQQKCHEYHQQNQDKIMARKNERYECICGSIVRRGGKAEHERSMKHCNAVQALQEKK